MQVSKLEKSVGIEVFITSSPGVGGIIRDNIEDFIVEEVLVDGSKAQTDRTVDSGDARALDSSLTRNRYLICVLAKRNRDTLSAVKAVADHIGVNVGRVQIAGLKDARAVTAQHITIEDVSIDDVRGVKIKDIELYPVGYFHSRLSSFYLFGNRFNITIRSISHSESATRKRTARIAEELGSVGGVPNFFGHQRFGTIRPITHLVGKAIIQGNLPKAALLFLAKPSPYEHSASREARETLHRTRDFKQALSEFPRHLRYERVMIKHLAEEPEDYVGAFRRLPLKLRELFVQAYQSCLFNRFLSRRIAAGLPLNRAENGDYVVSVQRSGLPMASMYKMVGGENIVEVNKAITAGKMRLALPLIGFKQHPSRGFQGEIERAILEEESVEMARFKVAAIPEICLRGELRCALTPLRDFAVDGISKEPVDASKCKMGLSFMLYRSSYATVVLRELMKPRSPIRSGF